jgi:threonine/homoserine/homoserine lactone efflux protein
MLGGATHTLFGVFGVGALISFAPSLFTLMLCAGAAYMAWIGWTLVRSSIVVDAVQTIENRPLGKIFRQGATTCLLNPKAYFFVVSVYPQFVGPRYGALWSQAAVLGAMTLLTQFGVYGGLATAAGRSRDFLVANPPATAFVGRLAGLLLISVAGLAAWRACAA